MTATIQLPLTGERPAPPLPTDLPMLAWWEPDKKANPVTVAHDACDAFRAKHGIEPTTVLVNIVTEDRLHAAGWERTAVRGVTFITSLTTVYVGVG